MKCVLVFALVATAAVVSVIAITCTTDSDCTADRMNCTHNSSGFCHEEPTGNECHCHAEDSECSQDSHCQATCAAQNSTTYTCTDNQFCHCY